MMDRPSAIAAIMPYSMPLCTILTKWPAPAGPQCRYPSGAAPARVRPGAGARGSSRPGLGPVAWAGRLRRGGGAQPPHRAVLAADHQAEAAFQAEHATRGADVDVVQNPRDKLL